MIDWTNPECMVSTYFKVKEALLLHSYGRLATEDDGVDFYKLEALCQKLDEIRELLDNPMNVHCMFRSQQYNADQGISPVADVHSMSIACDFDCNPNMSIDDIKNALEPQLAQLGIRMEKGTTTWVHVDLRAPGPSGRYFTP